MLNPYERNAIQSNAAPQARRARRFRWAGFSLLMTGPLAIAVGLTQSLLLEFGVINTKDLRPFFGIGTGNLVDHLLNVWHWDMLVAVLVTLAIPNAFIGIWMIRLAARQRDY
jgi:hypothetical protein